MLVWRLFPQGFKTISQSLNLFLVMNTLCLHRIVPPENKVPYRGGQVGA